MSDIAGPIAGVGLPAIIFAGYWLAFEWWPEWKGRKERDAVDFVTRRQKVGLPPHERCLCSGCVEWRAVPANVSRLQE